MTPSPAVLQPSEVVELVGASSLPRAREWRIAKTLASHRRDPARRQQFVVAAGTEQAFLTIGPDLDDLGTRTALFTNTYPDLAPKFLGKETRNGRMLLLQEYVAGQPLLEAYPSDAERVMSSLSKLQEAFQSRLSASTTSAAAQELENLRQEVFALDLWRDQDRIFLNEVVFPFVIRRLIPARANQRVSNCDFISRNLLVREDGRLCVIDYEHAASTHFYGEDWFRFGYWENLPAPIQDFLSPRISDSKAWKVYFALRQLVLEARNHRRRPFLVDAQRWCREIVDALASDPECARDIPSWPRGALTLPFTVGVQLFWETPEGDWSESASEILEVGAGEHHLVFSPRSSGPIRRLRLDPLDLPGIARVTSVLVQEEEGNRVLFQANGDSLRNLVPSGDASVTVLAGNAGLRVESKGNDPQLYFPPLSHATSSSLKITVVLSVAAPSHDAR